MGRIGRIVAKRAKGFGMKIIYYNRKKLSDDLEEGAKYYESVKSMMPDCDFVSIHTPATSETKNILVEVTSIDKQSAEDMLAIVTAVLENAGFQIYQLKISGSNT